MTYKAPIKDTNEIVLRPRFQLEMPYKNEVVLEAFEKTSQEQNNFIVKRIDDHVFIKFPRAKQQYWTPQLHLEINEEDSHNSKLYGLFGPNPTVWLLFMFLHFVVGLTFLAFSIWGYTNWSLGNDFFWQAIIAVLMIFVWVVLYVFGRIGRDTTKPEMRELKLFMDTVLNTIENTK